MKTFRLILLLGSIVLTLADVSYSQEKLTTPLGQQIELYKDGTWKYKTKKIVEDNSGMILVDADPLVAPRKDKFGMDDRHSKGIKILKDTVLIREVREYLDLRRNNSKADLMKSHLSLAENSGIKIHQKMFGDSIKIFTKLASNNQKQIEHLINVYSQLQLFDDVSPKKRNSRLTSIGELVDMDMKDFTSNNLSTKTNKSSSKSPKSVLNYKTDIVCQRDSTFKTRNKSLSPKLQYWFSYTPQKMKPYFKSRNLVTGYCAIAKIDGKEYLRLKNIITSKDAATNYGGIAEGSFMKLVFITGKTISIKAIAKSTSSLENYTGNIIVETLFSIDKDVKKLFENVPVDTIGIMWSSGFEVYPIYEVDALINSVYCYDRL
jgi:hypothetical protein